jgi:hypothetical protein
VAAKLLNAETYSHAECTELEQPDGISDQPRTCDYCNSLPKVAPLHITGPRASNGIAAVRIFETGKNLGDLHHS